MVHLEYLCSGVYLARFYKNPSCANPYEDKEKYCAVATVVVVGHTALVYGLYGNIGRNLYNKFFLHLRDKDIRTVMYERHNRWIVKDIQNLT